MKEILKEHLELILGEELARRSLTISVAESCTGGLLGSRITDVPGSSAYFMGGIIAYSNEVKIKELQVKEDTIAEHGAVSEETAREMAINIKRLMDTDLGLAVTGIAGPDGGSKEKPVGLVYVALASNEDVEVYRLNLKGDRKENKWQTTDYALYFTYKYISGKEDFI
ncbi:MAG: CinA family protein [Halanaerobiaceae bacterium]|nr:CinA family protein [Halanaerobiaceae bacterium]